jgi:kynurenine formamidase
VSDAFLEGLIIRTLPNLESKKSIDYMKQKPSFFTLEAMKYIRSRGVKHLMVDIPSVDRLFDDGHLSCHNIFWDTSSKKLNTAAIHFTITEMIYVDNNICDGSYFTNLQIPAFNSDAAPSRPIIFSINEL